MDLVPGLGVVAATRSPANITAAPSWVASYSVHSSRYELLPSLSNLVYSATRSASLAFTSRSATSRLAWAAARSAKWAACCSSNAFLLSTYRTFMRAASTCVISSAAVRRATSASAASTAA